MAASLRPSADPPVTFGPGRAEGPPGDARRRPRWLAPAGVGVAAGLAGLYTLWQDPNTAGGIFPQCPLKQVTGLDCPGCGGLRATHALLHGDIAGAFGHNVVITLLLPVAVGLWALWLGRSLGWRVPKLPTVPKPLWFAFAVAVIAFAVVRNIEGVALFEYLNSTT